jgi:acetyltransferase-like isoleucine patch superfamily enzyme
MPENISATPPQDLLSHAERIFIRLLCLFVPSKNFRIKLRNIANNKGGNNKVIIVKNGKEYVNRWLMVPNGLKIRMTGDNNIIKLTLPMTVDKSGIIILSNKCRIAIGGETNIHCLKISCIRGEKQSIKIGSKTYIGGATIRVVDNGTSCVIGTDCILSFDIYLRCSDEHRMLDQRTGNPINKQRHPLTIGNHCWIGQRAALMKNAKIPDNSVVGFGSVVSSQFIEEYTCISGNPAKIIKRHINWNRDSID